MRYEDRPHHLQARPPSGLDGSRLRQSGRAWLSRLHATSLLASWRWVGDCRRHRINTHRFCAKNDRGMRGNRLDLSKPRPFRGASSADAAVEVSGALRHCGELSKLQTTFGLGSDHAAPRRLKLPATQPGSSIMPGKVNRQSEMVLQVGARSSATTQPHVRCQFRQFELNTMLPVIAHNRSNRLVACYALEFSPVDVSRHRGRCRALWPHRQSLASAPPRAGDWLR